MTLLIVLAAASILVPAIFRDLISDLAWIGLGLAGFGLLVIVLSLASAR